MANRWTEMAALVQTHQAGVWRYLRYLGCDPAEADDLTQETFLGVLRDGFDERSQVETAGRRTGSHARGATAFSKSHGDFKNAS